MKKWLYIFLSITAIQAVCFGQSKPNPFDVYRGTQEVPVEFQNKPMPSLSNLNLPIGSVNVFSLDNIAVNSTPTRNITNVPSADAPIVDSKVPNIEENDTSEIIKNQIALDTEELRVAEVDPEVFERVEMPPNPFDVDTAYVFDSNNISKPKKSGSSRLKSKVNDLDIDGKNQFAIGIYLLSLVILALAITQRRKTFRKLFKALFNNNVLLGIRRDENDGNSIFMTLLMIVFLLIISLFFTQTYSYYKSEYGFNLYIKILGAVSFVFIIRYIIMSLLDYVISGSKIAKDHRFSITFHSIITGILILPISMLFQYTDYKQEIVYIGFGIIILLFAIRQIKGLLLALFERGIKLFHFFIYLCAVELAPILFFLKYFGLI